MPIYLHRKISQRPSGGGSRDASIYHLLALDGETARCGKAKNGEHGYELVGRDRPVLRAMTCNNCAKIPRDHK